MPDTTPTEPDMKRTCQMLLLMLLAGCSTTTTVRGDWQEEPSQPAFSHVLVLGVTPSTRIRRSFEVALAELLDSSQTRATAAIVAAGNADAPTVEGIRALAQANGVDGVLVTRLVARKVAAHETASRMGVKTARPVSLRDGPGLIELFSLDYNEYEDPGEFTAQSTATTETSLYDLRRDDQLVYVVTTESKFREDRDDVIADITRAIARQLTQAGLVR